MSTGDHGARLGPKAIHIRRAQGFGEAVDKREKQHDISGLGDCLKIGQKGLSGGGFCLADATKVGGGMLVADAPVCPQLSGASLFIAC